MELNIETKQQLDKLLAKPNLAGQEHIPFLQNLIETYPYYQPLYLLLAKASNGSEKQQQAFTLAALYNNGNILHRMLHEPQTLINNDEINIITNPTWNSDLEISIDLNDVVKVEEIETLATSENTVEDAPEIENLAPLPNEIIAVDDLPEAATTQEIDVEKPVSIETEKPSAHHFVVPEIENLAPLESEVIKVCEAEEQPREETQTTAEADEQETFEEITELVPPQVVSTQSGITKDEEIIEVKAEAEMEPSEELISQDELLIENEQPVEPSIDVKERDLIEVETFASANFFAFDTNFSSEQIEEETGEEQLTKSEPNISTVSSFAASAKENIVSKYDDDQLPFTFLWWLAKTRKDHEQIFRPFVSTNKPAAQTQDLHQQYVENIFHIQAPFEPEQETETSLQKGSPTKESAIIDTFIKNDPQIKALPPNQINNENKAKKSAEDSNDLVSETLAQIYIEQTLYHKAIDTYQKLSLKFPEKSGYFADLIQSLEKKI
ncbi:MAG: hypothetical protein REI64_06690 [Pedobacter sp.]|uniref:hypothetical protein n=1 Tax=Pedobacter sp. TaxID=1411316 RepID=UPI00280855C5|nr:hypothetical protein [Pedobacter sp.]MDQ8004472.1 hypothetical protein [Pedobacter sp.]